VNKIFSGLQTLRPLYFFRISHPLLTNICAARNRQHYESTEIERGTIDVAVCVWSAVLACLIARNGRKTESA